MYTHARGRGCSMGEGCGCRGGGIHHGGRISDGGRRWFLGADGGPPPAFGLVPLEAGTVQERGRGARSMGATLPGLDGWRIEEGRRVSSVGGGGCWFLMRGRRVLVVAPVVEGVPGEGPGHICGQNGPRCKHRARSVAAAFACEMGVFCGEVRLKISVLEVFLAVEWGSKQDWCEDLLIFFRKWLGDMRCFFVYYARGWNNRDNVMEIHCFCCSRGGVLFFAFWLQV